MAIEQSFIPIGETGEKLDSVRVDTPAGLDLHRETVVAADPENPDGLGRVVNTEPASDVYAAAVRAVGVNAKLDAIAAGQLPDGHVVHVGSKPVAAKTIMVNAAGPTAIVTPAAGKRLRLYWYSIQARSTNTAGVTVGLRFGPTGDPFHEYELSQFGGMAAHSVRAGDGYYEGVADQALFILLSDAQMVRVNIDYEEV